MKLRPWTFDKDKEVVLKWIGNVEVVNKQWRIRAAFEENNRIEVLDFPIAALQLLRIGAFYKDGSLMDSRTTGIVYDVDIPHLNKNEIVTALDACKDFGYYLYRIPELMFQSIFEFKVEDKIYYLPQFEFIRAVFATNKTITNAMIQPNGLEMLVEKASSNKYKAYLELADEVPNVVVKDDDFVRYFAWLYFNPEIKSSFESIYTLLKFKQSNRNYLKLELNLPNMAKTHIQFRGIQKGNKFLILQWLGSNLAGITFSDIEVKHKAFKKTVITTRNRKYRKSFKQDEFENILNDNVNERSKQNAHQLGEEIKGTQFEFESTANIHKVFGDEKELNKGDIYISNQGQGGGIQKYQQQIVGLDESVYGESIQPIEFKTLDVTVDIKGQGLEKFIEMIRVFSDYMKKYEVKFNILYLPFGRKFSFLSSGKRRCCGIVHIKNKFTYENYYLIEVATPDNKSLSTLMIKNINLEDIELVLEALLITLVNNSGRWNNEFLKKLEHKRLKHTKGSNKDWANNIEKYLNFY